MALLRRPATQPLPLPKSWIARRNWPPAPEFTGASGCWSSGRCAVHLLTRASGNQSPALDGKLSPLTSRSAASASSWPPSRSFGRSPTSSWMILFAVLLAASLRGAADWIAAHSPLPVGLAVGVHVVPRDIVAGAISVLIAFSVSLGTALGCRACSRSATPSRATWWRRWCSAGWWSCHPAGGAVDDRASQPARAARHHSRNAGGRGGSGGDPAGALSATCLATSTRKTRP